MFNDGYFAQVLEGSQAAIDRVRLPRASPGESGRSKRNRRLGGGENGMEGLFRYRAAPAASSRCASSAGLTRTALDASAIDRPSFIGKRNN